MFASTRPLTLGLILLAGFVLLTGFRTPRQFLNSGNASLKAGVETDESRAVSTVSLAARLVDYGLTTNDPLILANAALLLSQLPTERLDAAPTSSGIVYSGPQPRASRPKYPALQAQELIETVRVMAGSDEAVSLILDRAEIALNDVSRARVGGPSLKTEEVGARDFHLYEMAFFGGEIARITLSGDGTTDLDLYVYDDRDNLIAFDTREGDFGEVAWTPLRTGPFSVVVVNNGPADNRYTIATN